MTEDLHFAKPDYDRQQRRGMPEVIYGAGKTAAQITAIMRALNAAGQNAFATRVTPEQASAVRAELPDAIYREDARILTHDVVPLPERKGKVAVLCAGTSDLPVSREASRTLEYYGERVSEVNDVGVAGLHRLLGRIAEIRAHEVVIAVAGMDAAIVSVLGGLVKAPVIAVPTSVGYGAARGGETALAASLSSCAAGVAVVNIDNGFGAACAAMRILNRDH